MLVVVHLSDVHFGAHVEGLANSLRADISGHRPDLVVVSGDLTQRGRRREFADARAFLDDLPGPVLAVPGNHDLPLFDLSRRVLSPTKRYERFIAPDLNPVVSLPDLVAVGLDTMPAWRWKAGRISPWQADLVRTALGEAPAGAWRLLVTHHPLLPAERSGLVGRRLLADACAHARASVLLAGHTHTASATVVTLDSQEHPWRSLAVTAGTAMSRRTRGTPNAYAVVRLSGPMREGETLSVDIRELHGTGWSTTRSMPFGYGAGGVFSRACDGA